MSGIIANLYSKTRPELNAIFWKIVGTAIGDASGGDVYINAFLSSFQYDNSHINKRCILTSANIFTDDSTPTRTNLKKLTQGWDEDLGTLSCGEVLAGANSVTSLGPGSFLGLYPESYIKLPHDLGVITSHSAGFIAYWNTNVNTKFYGVELQGLLIPRNLPRA